MLRVAILGGTGNFGGYVARSLADDPRIELILCGRSLERAEAAASVLEAANTARGAVVDLAEAGPALAALEPNLVINMVGPYHTQDYAAPRAAIACGAHYCDIADARDFVCGIVELDAAAREAGVAVLAGASSVPALTAAYIDDAIASGLTVRSVSYGISGAEQANRGVGTVSAVLSYVGKPFLHLRDGAWREVKGWSGLHTVRYPELGLRWFGAGNVPDLGLFPDRYPDLRDHSFWAGHEIAPLHWGTWAMGWLVQWGLLPRLDRFAGQLARVSSLFNWMGRSRSGFHMFMDGEDAEGQPFQRKHWIIARNGDGPHIPCIPVILIARMLASGLVLSPGARPCLDLITLKMYRDGMDGLDVTFIDE